MTDFRSRCNCGGYFSGNHKDGCASFVVADPSVSRSGVWADSMDYCNCMVPYLEGAGQHSPSCRCLQAQAPSGTPQCGACRGDGSIPDAVCTLPVGHEGAHYG